MKILRTPNTLDLSLANIDARSVNVEWNARENCDPDDVCGVPLCYESDYELILPAPTYGDADAYAADLLSPTQRKTAAKSPDRPLPDALREAFEVSDGYYEWRAGFDPMMNYVWPVDIAYQVTTETVAALINEFAPTCTLVEFTSADKIGADYGIALSGGGMNLSDQLAIAYLCCGCVPPADLLASVPGVIDGGKLKQCGAALRKAYARAAVHYKQRAARMKEEAARIAAKLKPKA